MSVENDKLVLLLGLVDGSGADSEYEAIKQLESSTDELPSLLYQKYQTAKKAKERCACIHYSTKFAKKERISFELGLDALSDKSKHVRHLACLLLAWSLREDALPELRKCEIIYADDDETLGDIRAAIDSIEHQNSDYFVDRDHSGMVTLKIRQ